MGRERERERESETQRAIRAIRAIRARLRGRGGRPRRAPCAVLWQTEHARESPGPNHRPAGLGVARLALGLGGVAAPAPHARRPSIRIRRSVYVHLCRLLRSCSGRVKTHRTPESPRPIFCYIRNLRNGKRRRAGAAHHPKLRAVPAPAPLEILRHSTRHHMTVAHTCDVRRGQSERAGHTRPTTRPHDTHTDFGTVFSLRLRDCAPSFISVQMYS